MGKTTALRDYVETAEPRVFILDPFNDFGTVRARYTLQDALTDMTREGPIRRRVVPPITDESREYAEEFFALAVENLRDCLIVMDEMSLWAGKAESPRLRTLILQGRRLGLRMAIACQRISLIPGVALSEGTDMLLFKMTRPRDLQVVSEWSSSEVAEECRTLEIGECIHVPL